MGRLARSMVVMMMLAVGACSQESTPVDQHEFRDGQWVAATRPSKDTVEGHVALIRLKVAKGQNVQALKEAKEFLKQHPQDLGREEVMMLAGQAELNRGRLFQAFEWFKRQWDEYPAGTFSERALQKEYEIAEAFLAGKKRIVAEIFFLPARDEGLEILQKILEQAPGSVIAERAILRIAEDHFAHREYAESAQAYDRHLVMFGKSAKVRDVMLQAAKATHLSYAGDGYDSGSLIDAQQRYQTFAEQYPQTARKAGVESIVAVIDQQRAQDEFSTAQFYERVGSPRAAAFYYGRVRDRHAQSNLAKPAELALRRLGDVRPPTPPVAMVSTRPAYASATGPGDESPAAAAHGDEGTPVSATAPATGPADGKGLDSEPVDLEKLWPEAEQ